MNQTQSVREFLDAREAELQRAIEGLHRTLVPLEAELADVRKAKAAITARNDTHPHLKFGAGKSRAFALIDPEAMVRPSALASLPPLSVKPLAQPSLPIPQSVMPSPPPAPPQSPYTGLTQQRLVLKALSEHFANGATAIELVEFFHNAWGRTDIVRSSLSPQLSRLKAAGAIKLDGMVWSLVPRNEEAPADESEGASKSSSTEEDQSVFG